MSSRFFGQYLLEKGRITSQRLIEAMDLMKGVHTPLGTLAIEKGMLTAEQVKKIHAEQKKTDRRFGELAMDMGFLVQSQVNELLEAQASQEALLGEALMSKGYITVEVLERELKSHREEEERITTEISAFFNKVLHKDIVKTFTDWLIIMFTRFGNQETKIEQGEVGKKKVRLFRWVISQQMEGNNIKFNFLLSVPPKVLLQMASTMFNETISQADELALDAAKEFVNVANGRACEKLSAEGMYLKMSPPEVHETTQEQYSLDKANEVVCVHLASPDAKFDIGFEF
ncbi:MAG: chemotaxis protein CheX [Candidatus Binatia bacterium]